MDKTNGQNVLDKLADWIGGYMVFGDQGAMSVILALWCLHTWITEHLDSTPYLCVTAPGPGMGKTRLLEVCSLLARNARLIADTTGPTLFKVMDHYNGKCCLLFDEAERYSGATLGTIRSLMNSGYRSGQTVDRSTRDGFVAYPVYCSKAFSLMGDLNPALRSRSLVVRLGKAKPAKMFHWNTARIEGAKLVELIKTAFVRVPASIEPAHLADPRDVEIWSALYAVAHAIEADKETFAILDRVSTDIAQQKKHTAKKYAALIQTDDPMADKQYGVRALVDLASIMRANEPFLWSSVAVERMKAIATSPWRSFVDDDGLTMDRLSRLLAPWPVKHGTARMHRGKGARQADSAKGYFRASVLAEAVKVSA